MNDFIGNNIKLIVDWGQIISGSLILFFLFLIWRTVRHNRYFLPKGIIQVLGITALVLVLSIFSLVFAKITKMKPQVEPILARLEGLIGQPAPPLYYFRASDSQPASLASHKGEIVLVNYWATWCRPCIKEIPDLEAIQKAYGPSGVTVLMISDETHDKLRKFIDKNDLLVNVGRIDYEFDWAPMGNERPVTFLVNKQGVITHYFTGRHDFAFFEKYLKEALAG